jgi:hypothetical protein
MIKRSETAFLLVLGIILLLILAGFLELREWKEQAKPERPAPERQAVENLPLYLKAQIRISGPVDLHVYDSENRHVGVNENRWLEEQIPGVYFYLDRGDQCVRFDNLYSDNYRAEVVGLENGTLSIELVYEGILGVEYGHRLQDLPVVENEKTKISLYQRAIKISPLGLGGLPGETLSFSIAILNIDNIVDNFTLTAEGERGWDLSISPGRFGNLVPNESRVAVLTVTVPKDPPKPALEKMAAVLRGTRLVAFTTFIAVAKIREVAVSVSPEGLTVTPGETVTYVVTISNEGTLYDNYILTVSDTEGWGLSLSENLLVNVPPFLPLYPFFLLYMSFENKTVILSVAVPDNAMPGTRNLITIVATSAENRAVSDNAIAKARVEDGGSRG